MAIPRPVGFRRHWLAQWNRLTAVDYSNSARSVSHAPDHFLNSASDLVWASVLGSQGALGLGWALEWASQWALGLMSGLGLVWASASRWVWGYAQESVRLDGPRVDPC